MPLNNSCFAGFEYQPSEICKFLQAYTTFTLMLRSGIIIHYQPEHAPDFERWLHHHQIEDIRVSIRNNQSAFSKRQQQ